MLGTQYGSVGTRFLWFWGPVFLWFWGPDDNFRWF